MFISIFSPVSLPCFNSGWFASFISVSSSWSCCFLCSAKNAFHLCYQMFFRFWFCTKERADEESGGVTQVNVRMVNSVPNFVDNLWNAVLGVAETTHSCARGVFLFLYMTLILLIAVSFGPVAGVPGKRHTTKVCWVTASHSALCGFSDKQSVDVTALPGVTLLLLFKLQGEGWYVGHVVDSHRPASLLLPSVWLIVRADVMQRHFSVHNEWFWVSDFLWLSQI